MFCMLGESMILRCDQNNIPNKILSRIDKDMLKDRGENHDLFLGIWSQEVANFV